ncbi:MAG: sulfatase [Deltaproteobacteria bacterium]|nr:sulfatase [Deltaproteobacteria bacterium]MBW2400137.1 sulfatase [Deltaproteobacteria bacterium]MBW2666992.1 sulfatase [Deltaproteobacteria bacterium]
MLRPLALSILLFVALACQRESPESEALPAADLAGKNLIVITLDTSRQDHFSCYGVPEFRGTTPHIDDLAADGALFLNGYSQTNITNPSHAAIFTGLYAIDLKVMNNHVPLPTAEAGVDTLSAAFQRSDYRTAAFPAVSHLTALAVPGFDESAPPRVERIAGDNVDLFLTWVEQNAPEPFFAWLHLFDPHAPYEPPERFRVDLHTGDPTQGEAAKLGATAQFQWSPPIVQEQFAEVRDRAYPKAMYRGEVRYTDDQVGRLISALKERGLYDDTAIVVVGDHGESLGEHEIYYDHAGLYEASLRIPFVLRIPGFPRGVRIAESVSHVDLVPTLAQLFGLEIETSEPLRGVSLVDAIRGEPSPPLEGRQWLIHEAVRNTEVALRRGPWKAIFLIFSVDGGPPVRLFNLEDDPGEETNVVDAHSDIVAELQPLVQRWIDQHIWDLGNDGVEEAMLERLRALGYLSPNTD